MEREVEGESVVFRGLKEIQVSQGHMDQLEREDRKDLKGREALLVRKDLQELMEKMVLPVHQGREAHQWVERWLEYTN